jgi:uncharacterized protein
MSTSPASHIASGLARIQWLLIAELLLLYVAAPVAMAWAVHVLRIPLVLMLLGVLALLLVILLRDRTFDVRAMVATAIPWTTCWAILALLPLGAAIVLGLGWYLQPEAFLAFPRDRTSLWLLVMVLYPVLSVTAQEVLYRVFFFHRYRELFAGRPTLAIVANAALFGFGHIVLLNWIAVGLSFLAGLVLAWRYQRTQSYWAVVLEHGIYGDLIFTAGLGAYFFTGIANFRA